MSSWKNQRSLEFEHADGMVLNQLRFFPASMCILSILGTAGARTDSWNSEGRWLGKRGMSKAPGYNCSTSLLHPEQRTLWGHGKEQPCCWSLLPDNSRPKVQKEISDLDCKCVFLTKKKKRGGEVNFNLQNWMMLIIKVLNGTKYFSYIFSGSFSSLVLY